MPTDKYEEMKKQLAELDLESIHGQQEVLKLIAVSLIDIASSLDNISKS